jgi:SpoVK/Ycf46/Vps4 family AAA+-type ATPase
VLVTSNLADNIDPAFQRRMDRVVDFSPPSADERLALWSVHLPEDHAVSEATLRQVARQCALNGGQIRTAARQATLLALDEATGQNASVRDEHIAAAVRDEYQKDGAVCPLGEASREEPRSGAQRFTSRLAP